MRRFHFDSRSRRLWLLAALIATVMVFLETRLEDARQEQSDRKSAEHKVEERRTDESAQGAGSAELHPQKFEFIELE